jgi:hypothetical protein|tara:strand:- start:284 stop:523 length:240 start_codon:yes stop_codon:yes gene_type:complete
MKKLGSSRNQCGGCHQYFNSNSAFEQHRTGEFGVDRRCKTIEEIEEDGMRLNTDGFWRVPMTDANVDKLKAKRSALNAN